VSEREVLEEHTATIFRTKSISHAKKHAELKSFLDECLAYALTLKTDAAYYSKTSVNVYLTSWLHIPESRTLLSSW
jgi:hypothetical protein